MASSLSTDRVRTLGGSGPRTPIFCMHPSGGDVTDYAYLASRLGDEHPVHAIRSRACEDASREHASIRDMACEYASLVRDKSAGPYWLFGWSMGGLIAHAVACELECRGELVDLVGMVDPVAFSVERSVSDDAVLAVGMAIHAFHPSPPPLGHVFRELRSLSAGIDGRGLAKLCEDRGILPAGAVSAAAFDAMMALLPKHRRLAAEHEPGVCRARVVIWGVDPRYHRRGFDWSAHTEGGLEQRVAGGTHYTVMRPPHADTIAAHLRELAEPRPV